MHVLILATGRTREAAILSLEQEYARRLPAPWTYDVRELKASTATDTTVAKREESAVQRAALHSLPPGTVTIALDEAGKLLSSTQWAEHVERWQNSGTRTLAFLIGGAAGLLPEVKQACTTVWSLSPLTMPHQLVRAMLAEQVYRTFTLRTGHPYHRP